MIVNKKELVTKECIVSSEEYCDKCNKKIESNLYELFEAQFLLKKSDSYFPEEGYGVKLTVDLCETCANELLSWFTNNNYRVNKEEWNY